MTYPKTDLTLSARPELLPGYSGGRPANGRSDVAGVESRDQAGPPPEPINAPRAADNAPSCRYCHKPIKAASWGNWGHLQPTDFRHYAVPERVR